MIIKTEVEIPPRRIADLMVTAIEGGIGYWCKSTKCLQAVGIFKVGETYETYGGDKVKFVGVSEENEGTTYETMFDEKGVHRYTIRDFGRITGTHNDLRNIKLNAPWYDHETIYQPQAFNSKGNLNPRLLIEVIERDPSSDVHKDGRWLLDLDKMERGFNLMQTFGRPKGYCWRDFISENEDAITADVWFQLAVFGEVVYS